MKEVDMDVKSAGGWMRWVWWRGFEMRTKAEGGVYDQRDRKGWMP